jgi:DNA-binding transcriptional MerR regulator
VYYRIGDIARELDEEPHVIRFWEGEFHLRPQRSKKGQRVYSEAHLAKLRLIRFLIRDELYTLDGARRQLKRLDQWAI